MIAIAVYDRKIGCFRGEKKTFFELTQASQLSRRACFNQMREMKKGRPGDNVWLHRWAPSGVLFALS